MKIKENLQLPAWSEYLSKFKSRRILFFLFVLGIYSAGLILFAAVLHKEGFFGEILKPAIQENIRIPGNYLKGLMSEPEKLIIDIKHKDYLKLAYKRKVALEEEVLHPFPDDFVPAKIRWKGKTIKVRLRLKGDLADHWARDHKWSFRVKTKGKNTVMGMKNFSLQHPRTRGFLNDWHLHKMLQQFGFITLRYDFVEVTVNGRHLGVYAIEEHFEKSLLDNNHRINGPIVRIKDHLLWYRIEPSGVFSVDTIDELYTSSPVDAFTTGTINNDPVLLENFKKAKDLLELFRRGKLYTHQVFDIEKLSKLFAIIDLFGYRHTTAYSNIRFYYNPVTSLLVPIGYDNTFIEPATSIEGQTQKIRLDESFSVDRLDWKRTFFEDKVFFKEYMKAVRMISDETFLPGFFDRINDEYNEKMAIIYRTFPGYSFNRQRNMLFANQKFISKILNPLEAIQAYVKDIDIDKQQVTLQIGNIQLLPVELLNISYHGKVFDPVLKNDDERIIQSKTPYDVMDFREFTFKVPKDVLQEPGFRSALVTNYRLYGLDEIKQLAVFQWPYMEENFITADLIRQPPNVDQFDFIKIDDTRKLIWIKAGDWQLDRNLIIPKGYTFLVEKGVTLDLTHNAKVLSYSAIEFQGISGYPVVIKSSDGTGQGIAIIKAHKPSVFNYVKLDGLKAPEQDGWNLNAVVTFYESESVISNTVFSKVKAATGLEVIRSEFKIKDTVFSDQIHTALKLIFSKGQVKGLYFKDVKDDAIYLSGSMLQGEKITAENVSGQVINLNDESDVNISKINITKSGTAVVARDSSQVELKLVELENIDNGFIAFNKKSQFGPARITVDKAVIKNVSNVNQAQEKSVIEINGERIRNTSNEFSIYN